ncbi:MAG: response regulator [Succinivibrio sp.]|nr:response regulator [Succinivibrio sp.]
MEQLRESSILVIDDDNFILKIVNRMLSADLSFKTSLFTTLSGREGLEILKKEEIDLVLLDVNMPEIDGMEVLEEIRKIPSYASVPVIMMSAIIKPELEAEAFKRGATDFIHKPFTTDVIIGRMYHHLRFSYLQRSLHEEVKKQTALAEERLKANEQLFNETVMALAQTIDAKDQYTRGHSLRVAKYSRSISRISGDSEEEQQNVFYAGLLHDIGKIGINEQIINKHSKLTDEEYETIKTHPTIGWQILSLIKINPTLSIGAHYHHERYDGKGYPEGLKGDQIPRLARIICVADTYDSMTSKRSYRDCLPQEVVKEQMEKGIGSQFDPLFAKIMLKMIEMDTGYRMRADLN